MRDLSVDFRLVRLALVSAQHGSFRQAAAALNVQQSSVSKAVRALEHRVGVELFERSHTGIRPTLAGDRFLTDAAQGFDYLERAIERVGAVRRNEHGELGVVASVPFRLFGHVLGQFRRQHTGVSVEIAEESCEAAALIVQQRKADIGFVTKRPTDEIVKSIHLADERLTAVLPVSHRLAQARSLGLAELRSEQFILSSNSLGQEVAAHLRQQLPKVGSDLSLQSHGVGECDLVHMVADGFGVAVVLASSISTLPKDVVLVPLTGHAKLPVHALWMDTNSNPALRSLLGILQQTKLGGTPSRN